MGLAIDACAPRRSVACSDRAGELAGYRDDLESGTHPVQRLYRFNSFLLRHRQIRDHQFGPEASTCRTASSSVLRFQDLVTRPRQDLAEEAADARLIVGHHNRLARRGGPSTSLTLIASASGENGLARYVPADSISCRSSRARSL